MKQIDFEKVVQEAIAALPDEFRNKLEAVEVVVAEAPTAKDLREADVPEDDALYGIFLGASEADRSVWDPADLPPRIVLYRRPLVEDFPERADLVREIQMTLFHEVGHFLGFDEDDLDRLGYS
ncbi:MAG: metallopeptidase family protein [Planctomycetota bacterium]